MSSAHHAFFATTSLVRAMLKAWRPESDMIQALDDAQYTSITDAKLPRPELYNTAREYAIAYFEYNVLRKYDGFPIQLDKEAVAISKFLDSEVSCGSTNREVGALPFVPGVQLSCQQQSIIEHAKSLIKRTLGKFNAEEFQASCDFSNGASTRCKRNSSHPIDKLNGRPQVTINCRDLAIQYIWSNELWRSHCQNLFGRESDPFSWVELVAGSRFSTVPKDSTTDRPICVEPDLNMFFQKGIGTMIRNRLYRVNINLNDQSVNQRLAHKGSVDNSLATIDLRGASDSISLEVVRMLLPEDWYTALLTTRSAYVFLNGKYVRLEKISSMGNGYTFELESLLFWALAKSCLKVHGLPSTHLSVYGDDIVVAAPVSECLIALLRNLGFETNDNKTFVDGPFRESCGMHYFEGCDVTPFFIKSAIITHQDIYHFCNSLQSYMWMDPDVKRAVISLAMKPIPPHMRCYVPNHYSSRAGLWSDKHRGKYSRRRQAMKFYYLAEERCEHVFNGPVAYLGAMLLGEQRVPAEYSITMKGNTRVVRRTGFTSVWNDLPIA